MAVRAFSLAVPESVLEDLGRRLDATLWPEPVEDAGWDYGTDVEFLKDLCSYWRHSYDWRAEEAALNRWPHFLVDVDGIDIHCIRVPGVGPDPVPLVLTHGWPSSFYEMHKVIGPLSDPARFGGDPGDAFHVVVPSLPGYGWSAAPRARGMSASRVADLWVGLMNQLGYPRFGAHGGDWGSAVSTALGAFHPDQMIGIHLTMLAPPVDEATLTPEQRIWWETVQAYRDREWGYVHLQRTKPQTAAFALTDSPAGLAAWITEKWWRWSDCADVHGNRDLWRVFQRAEILTTLTIYWATRTIGPSMRLYYETFSRGSVVAQPPRIEVPTGVAVFNEMNRPPRPLAEPYYNISRWTVVERGGHFPALENPDTLVQEIRQFFQPLRRRGG
jgi:microsomal epoxide hydrolase